MKRPTQRRLIVTGQWLLLAGLVLAVGWNLMGLWWPTGRWGLGLLLPLPGLLLWITALAAPSWQARSTPLYPETYRLLYEAPAGWDDTAARQALLTLRQAGVGLDFIWAREGTGVGCWLAADADSDLLTRLVRDVFPAGQIERDHPPALGQGVVGLRWREPPPNPVELCRLERVEGVYYRWHGPTRATLAFWGAEAQALAQQWLAPTEMLSGQGDGLRRPRFLGDNPWPELPPCHVLNKIYSRTERNY